jgi:hypothetical protein
MKPLHKITVFFISEEEKAAFLSAGVEFTKVTRGPRGEAAIFEIGEDDPRWERVAALIMQNISMSKPILKVAVRSPLKRAQSGSLGWLEEFSGQTVEELLSLEEEYRIDSLVLAFEQALGQKKERDESQALTDKERIVLAVEALEREMNNGGYSQFFTNSSKEFASSIVDSLQRIGCKRAANITLKAINALGISHLTTEAIETVMAAEDEPRLSQLKRCDDAYHKNAEPIAERLFAFIKANKASIRL